MKLGDNWIVNPRSAIVSLILMLLLATTVYFLTQYGTYFPTPDAPVNYQLLLMTYGNVRLIAALVSFALIIILSIIFVRALNNPILSWGIAAVPTFIAIISLLALLVAPSGSRLIHLDTFSLSGTSYHLTYALSLSSTLPPSPATYLTICADDSCTGQLIPLTSENAHLRLNEGAVQVLDGEIVRYEVGNPAYAMDDFVGDMRPITLEAISDLTLVAQVPLGYGYDIAYASTGIWVMSTLNGGMWHISRHDSLDYRRLPTSNELSYIEFNHAGTLIAGQHLLSDVTVWDAQSGLVVNTAPVQQTLIDAKQFALHPQDNTIAIVGEDNLKILLSDTEDFKQFAERNATLPIIRIDYSPDGRVLAMQSILQGDKARRRQLVLLDSASGERITSLNDLPYEEPIIAFSPDSTRLAYLSETWRDEAFVASELTIWDYSNGESVSLTLDSRLTDFAFSADSTMLFILSGTDMLVYDSSTLELLSTFTVDSQQANSIAVSDDSLFIAISGFDGMFKLYGLE